ncbi:MAG TPA: pyridoxamine 5'-phosphate oxidase [Candidatus Cybelea sp.]|nr:pyridoxamine 5'-phosphate oxidase [Candidatus Cybelea sp.]
MIGELSEWTADPDPVMQLQHWINDAAKAGVVEPIAMSLATADATGRPSVRVVLMRGLDARGLRFYTSYFSRKGRELEANPRAAAAFYWPSLERQVRVEGAVSVLSEDESDAYFRSRPRGHRVAAWASEQSAPIEARSILEERYAHFDTRFEGEEVPRPHSWGGYLIAPERFEFWQRRQDRMHDRLEYAREGGSWRLRRLQP